MVYKFSSGYCSLTGFGLLYSIATGERAFTGEQLNSKEQSQLLKKLALVGASYALIILTAGTSKWGEVLKTVLADMAAAAALREAGAPDWVQALVGLGTTIVVGVKLNKWISGPSSSYDDFLKKSGLDSDKFEELLRKNNISLDDLNNPQNAQKIEEILNKGSVTVSSVDDGVKTIDFSDYESTVNKSIHNADADKIMLGKYDDGGASSYITKAGDDYTYFDLGEDWNTIKAQQGLTDNEMFELYNKSFLEDAINEGKVVHFSHNPVGDSGFLGKELKYLEDQGYIFDPKTMTAKPHWLK